MKRLPLVPIACALAAAWPAAADDGLAKETLKKGMKDSLVHTPGVGVSVTLGEGKAIRFDNVKFSAAAWETYLGKKNRGDKIKRGLTARR